VCSWAVSWLPGPQNDNTQCHDLVPKLSTKVLQMQLLKSAGYLRQLLHELNLPQRVGVWGDQDRLSDQ
jgi:hypothetical protein